MISDLKKINFLISKRQRLGLILLAFLLLIGMVMEVFGLGILLPGISLIIDPEIINNNETFNAIYKFFSFESHFELVSSFLATILLVYFFKTVFLIFLTLKQNRFLNNIGAHIGNSLLTKYLKAPYKFHLERNSGALIKNLQIEVIYFQVYCLALITIIIESSLTFAVIATLIYIEPIGAISIGLFFGILSFIFYYTFKQKLKKWGIYREQLDAQISKIGIESLSVIKDLKVLNKEDFFIESFTKLNYIKSRISANHSTITQLPRFYLELVSIVGLVSFIFLMLLKGESPESLITVLGVFVAATFRLIPSLNRIISAFQNLKYYNKTIDLLYNEMLIKESPTSMEDKKFRFLKEIEFKNINFRYNQDSKHLFKSLNFKIKKGQTIGLIGGSGSGKSTFVNLLIGLLIPSSGEILVDGSSIEKCMNNWQNLIGYISQDIHLIDDSIIKNIALGIKDEDINMDFINNAIISAQLQPFIKTLPKGLKTKVGDKGIQISGGQRQRIGLARALYHNPEVLILDEATSSLDDKTERGVMESIELLSGNKTIIIIAHRLSTLNFCDKVYELNNSCFKESYFEK
jgi:ABC-type bacteriocin/lantibiotic exporter with double-glycine peptidase domain